MYYSNIKQTDVANGQGIRVTLFVSGCRNACKNCFQPQTWNFCYGEEFTDETCEKIIEYMKPAYIGGFTLLGGEPFEPENQADVLKLLKKIKEAYPSKSIWCFTGFVLEEELLENENNNSRARTQYTDEILSLIDVLVDGRYVDELRNLTLRFRGSQNQRLIDLKQSLINKRTVLWNGF